jgi:HK97 family phage prohead protease
MKTKTVPFRVKSVGEADGLQSGQFTAYASVFGNKDSYGDVVVKGAFTDTLAEWKASGDPIPVIWSHMSHDPDYHIGVVVEAAEDDNGLLFTGQLDMDEPKAAKIYRLLKGRRVKNMSFAYDVVDGGFVTKDEESAYELRTLKLYEVGPCLVGVNQDTELLAVKAHPCPNCGHTDSKAKPAPAPDATPTPAPAPAPAPSAQPNLSPASVLLSLQVDALAYDLD